MSLILDALKKSDRNRDRGKVPDLQADHSSITAPATPLRRYRRWLWLLLVLVVLGGGGLLWQLWPTTTASVSTPVRQPVSVPAPQVMPPTLPVTAPATVPLEPAKTTVAPKAEAPAAASVSSPIQPVKPAVSAPAATETSTSETTVYELANLPSHLAQGLPELTVSVHYYTPNPESRMVRINNRILRENGILPGGIKIASIEKNGIICEIQGVRFRLPTSNLTQ